MKGFTLIEIMVALLILSILSVAGLAGLNHMVRAHEQQTAKQGQYQRLTQAYAKLSQDFFYAVVLIGDEYENHMQVSHDHVTFSRTRKNTMGEIMPFQITYTWSDGLLKRSIDNSEEVLLSNLDQLKVFVLMKDAAWHEAATLSKDEGAPLGVRLTWRDSALGALTWSFALPY